MFINETKFKKLCNQAFKGMGLKISRDENDLWTIASNWWCLQVHNDDLTNKTRSMLTEIVGELPSAGEAMEYRYADNPQILLSGAAGRNVMEEYGKAGVNGVKWTFTNVMIRTSGDFQEVLQCTQSTELKTLIPHRIYEVFSEKNLKKESNETFPEFGLSVDAHDWIIWGSNVMWFGCMQRPARYKGEADFLWAIEGVNAWWTNDSSELIG